MKTLQILATIISLSLVACNSKNNKSSGKEKFDTISKTLKAQITSKKTQEGFELQQVNDSLKAEKSLKSIIDTLSKSKDSYKYHSDALEINYGYIFSKTIKHLFVKQNFQTINSINILKLENGEFITVHKQTEWSMTYINDSIRDVNGDGKHDYLYHWYPLSGCCSRDIYDVFLQKTNGDFTEKIKFINPTFSSNEKIIRGLCYGHGSPLYKYIWNKFSVDTIEFIYFPNSANGNKYIRRKHNNETETGQILKDLPLEYKKIGYSFESQE